MYVVLKYAYVLFTERVVVVVDDNGVLWICAPLDGKHFLQLSPLHAHHPGPIRTLSNSQHPNEPTTDQRESFLVFTLQSAR